MEAQILSAIRIAADPSQDRALQAQAVEFLNIVRGNARESCGVALTLFLEQNPDGSRKHDIHVRGFALQLLDDFLGGLVHVLSCWNMRALCRAFVDALWVELQFQIRAAGSSRLCYIRTGIRRVHTIRIHSRLGRS